MVRESRSAARDVKRAMHKLEAGKIESGRSGETVTSRKQAVARRLASKSAKPISPCRAEVESTPRWWFCLTDVAATQGHNMCRHAVRTALDRRAGRR
ncbi:MAG: DUF6496 domain-containing protein [Roseiarcus sp.]